MAKKEKKKKEKTFLVKRRKVRDSLHIQLHSINQKGCTALPPATADSEIASAMVKQITIHTVHTHIVPFVQSLFFFPPSFLLSSTSFRPTQQHHLAKV